MKKKRLIALTGAGGGIGRALIQSILSDTNWDVLAFSGSLEQSPEFAGRVRVVRNEEIPTLLPSLKDVDTCLHMAFSRRFRSNSDIALSLDFSSVVYKAAKSCGCRVINLSTVGVYAGNSTFPDETTVPTPDSLYSMAKYGSEVLFESYFGDSDVSHTNVRLSGIAQSQRVLPIFIDNAKNVGKIQITGGKQQFSWIDIDDAVAALIALIAFDGDWREIYNVSLDRQRYSIVDLAEIVSAVAESRGFEKTEIEITPSDDKPICVGWNSEAFISDTGWKPRVTIEETIKKMF